MAARNLTGSAWIRAAGNKSGTQKNSPQLATWIGHVRALIHAPIELLLRRSVRVDAGVGAAVCRRACHLLNSFREYSESRAAHSA